MQHDSHSGQSSLLTTHRGEHIHHGYFLKPEDTKEAAQLQLIELLLQRSCLQGDSSVLDVGCGIGGTSRYLAREYNCSVTGITISGTQVQMARNFTAKESGRRTEVGVQDYDTLGNGKVRFLELDAEKMDEYFHTAPYNTTFDAVWISEAMSHLPDKELFFRNAFSVLRSGGKLVIADWFKAEHLTSAQMKADIEPIEGSRFPVQKLGLPTLTGHYRWHVATSIMYAVWLCGIRQASWLQYVLGAVRHKPTCGQDMVSRIEPLTSDILGSTLR